MVLAKEARLGDTVDISWRNTGRHDAATVENVRGFTVTMRIAGPPEITIMIPADQLVAGGQHHWHLDM